MKKKKTKPAKPRCLSSAIVSPDGTVRWLKRYDPAKDPDFPPRADPPKAEKIRLSKSKSAT